MNEPPCNRTSHDGLTGKVIEFAAGFGRVRWSKSIGPSESSPLLVGDRLYVGDWNGDVWALDAQTGKTIWRFHTGGSIKGAVSTAGGRLYVGSYDGRLYCLTLDGKQVWRASAQRRLYGSGRFYSTPAVAYGRVYIGSTDGKVYSFGATTGKLRWSHSTGGYVYASPAVWRGLVFAGSYGKRFYAFDAATGDVRWSFTANGPISGSATVIGDVVYFATLNERTYALNARTGKVLWTFGDGKYTPAVATKDHLFLVGYGQVYGMVRK
jgi:outer membrane protein assembly factor BamB